MKINSITSSYIYILIIIISLSNSLISQTYQKFEKFETNQRTTWTHPFSFKSNGTAYYGNGIGQMTILTPLAKIKKIGKKIDIGKNEEMQCGGSIDSKPCVFLKKWEEKSKKESIYAMFYDETKSLSPKDAKNIFYIDYNNKKNKVYYPKNTLRCVSSDDESKFLIYYTAPYSKKENFKLGCFLGNSTFEKLTHRTIELPFEAEYKAIDQDMVNIKITNDGTVYILIKYLIDTHYDNFKKKEWNHKFFFCKISPDGKVKKLKDITLDKEDLNISSMIFSFNTKEEITGTAISSKTYLPVFFKYGIGENNYQKLDYVQLPKDLLDKNAAEKTTSFQDALAFKYKSDDVPSWTYKVRSSSPQNEGGSLIVAEQYTLWGSYHVYGKILVFHINSKNQIEWFKTINHRKNLYGATRESSAEYSFRSQFFFTQTENLLYFIYNTEFDKEPNAYVGSEKDKLDRITFVSMNPKNGEKINNKSIYIKKNSSGYLPRIEAMTSSNIIFYIDEGGRIVLDK